MKPHARGKVTIYIKVAMQATWVGGGRQTYKNKNTKVKRSSHLTMNLGGGDLKEVKSSTKLIIFKSNVKSALRQISEIWRAEKTITQKLQTCRWRKQVLTNYKYLLTGAYTVDGH